MRLLGQSELTQTELVIREMTQNSWDARLKGERPSIEFSFRDLANSETSTLSDLFSEGGANDLLVDLRKGICVLEVSDRGTVGLDGPVDFGEVGDGESHNYKDLVV